MKKKLKAILLAILTVVTLSACSAENETPTPSAFPTLPPLRTSEGASEAPAETPTAAQDAEYEESISLFIFSSSNPENNPVYTLAQEFMRQNPGKGIKIEVFDQNRTTTKEIRTAIAKLNGGDGPDVVEIPYLGSFRPEDWKLEYTDLNVLMAQDENFDRANYFEGILDSLQEDGALYVMPLTIFPHFHSVNRQYQDTLNQLLGNIDTISFAQMLDVYESAAMLCGSTEDLYLLDYPITYSAVRWIYDLAALKPSDRINFNSTSENEDLLRRSFNIPRMGQPFYDKIRSGELSAEDVEMVFANYINYNGNAAIELFLDYPDSPFAMPIGLEASNGKVLFNTANSLSINEACPNKALAWEFVKFCANNSPVSVEDSEQPIRRFFYSTNKDAFAAVLGEHLYDIYDNNTAQGRFHQKPGFEAVDDAVRRITSIMENCGQSDHYNRPFDFNGAIEDYRVNRISFEQLVARIEGIVRGWAE